VSIGSSSRGSSAKALSVATDGAVSEVVVIAKDSGGVQVGSGSLKRSGDAWKGDISVSATGLLNSYVAAYSARKCPHLHRLRHPRRRGLGRPASPLQ